MTPLPKTTANPMPEPDWRALAARFAAENQPTPGRKLRAAAEGNARPAETPVFGEPAQEKRDPVKTQRFWSRWRRTAAVALGCAAVGVASSFHAFDKLPLYKEFALAAWFYPLVLFSLVCAVVLGVRKMLSSTTFKSVAGYAVAGLAGTLSSIAGRVLGLGDVVALITLTPVFYALIFAFFATLASIYVAVSSGKSTKTVPHLLGKHLRSHFRRVIHAGRVAWLIVVATVSLSVHGIGRLFKSQAIQDFAQKFGAEKAMANYSRSATTIEEDAHQNALLEGPVGAFRHARKCLRSLDITGAARIFLESPFDPRWAFDLAGDDADHPQLAVFDEALRHAISESQNKSSPPEPDQVAYAERVANIARGLLDQIEMLVELRGAQFANTDEGESLAPAVVAPTARKTASRRL